MKMFNASLRHKVFLERKIQTTDGAGGYTDAWETIATLWAGISRLRGGEKFSAGQLSASSTHVFRLRYNHNITTDMRFSYDERLFNIRALRNVDERKRILDVYAEEGVAI
ncbi:MAG: phage head closure protein [Alphaproteobacteria bacterium]|nr:phage head closure protein [Alphaproteobacteria bacterium]